MKIFDTHTGRKVDFEPLQEGRISMYVCGPTVYDLAHLGHGRSAVAFDVIRRYFVYKGFEMKYVSNYTDIDDKMINRAAEEGISVVELTDKIVPEYARDYGDLNVMVPDVQPKATEHVDEMIDIIKRLEDVGHVYVLDDGVYFDVASYEAYGEFSGQDLEMLQMGARIDVKDEKKNPQDFVLWKFKKEGEPSWESPWGEGRPGWHIECSAMSYKHLGEKFDIHGGGLDLVFPHHECEVAQSCGAFGSDAFAKYWMHNGFINVDNEKMSKSLGNFFTLRDIFKKYDPSVVRFMFLQTHYRNPVNFSDVLLDQAKSGLERVRGFVRNLEAMKSFSEEGKEIHVEDYKGRFESFMDNDFDTSGALGVLFDLIKDVNVAKDANELSQSNFEKVIDLLREFNKVFAVIFADNELSDEIEAILKEREAARSEKDWAKSDELRDKLKSMGIEVEDTPNGTIWKKV